MDDRVSDIIRNKDFFKNNRFEYFKTRFIDGGNPTPVEENEYYPDSTYVEVISERTELTPMELSISGKEYDFIKKNLWDKSKISSRLPETYKEMDFAGDAFWRIYLKPSKSKDVLYEFDFEKLNTEEMFVHINTVTREPDYFLHHYVLYNTGENKETIMTQIREEYTIDTITITEYVPDTKGFMFSKKGNTNVTVIDNPFKEYGKFPIMWFKGYKNDSSYYSEIPANKLIEMQLQIDLLNTHIDTLIKRTAFPITEIKKALAKYNNVYLGAGSLWCSRGEEELKIHAPEVPIVDLQMKLDKKIDKMYRLCGLVPMSHRKDLFSSSSSKIAKTAYKEFIELVKTRLMNMKIEFDDMIELFMSINGKTRTDEQMNIPVEAFTIDKEDLLKIVSMEMALGLTDDEIVWKNYYPDVSEEEKTRIRENAQAKLDAIANSKNLNMDNKLKQGQVNGNKATNASSSEAKSTAITKK